MQVNTGIWGPLCLRAPKALQACLLVPDVVCMALSDLIRCSEPGWLNNCLPLSLLEVELCGGGVPGARMPEGSGLQAGSRELGLLVGRSVFQKDGLQPRSVSRPVCLTGPGLGHSWHREVPVPVHGTGLWFCHSVSVFDVTVAASFQALASWQAEFLL